jgi:uncharacterized protein YbjT (DUF2867 family)
MDVLVAGGHGQIALRFARLATDRGHRVRGLIRNPDHAAEVEAAGGEAVLCDMEREDVRPHVAGDAVVFAAGAGPGSGPERKRTVDEGAAIALMEAAADAGVRRYVMISSMGASDPESGSEAMRPYLRAKAAADAALRESGLEWTIVRPGGLTDDTGSGHVAAAPSLGRYGEIPRDDVALVLLEVLGAPSTVGVTFELLSGESPAADAVRALRRSG